MAIVLVVVSVIAWLAGILTLSKATEGVGGIAAACFFAILARIAQAKAHHDELKKITQDRIGMGTSET